ncbi:MAG: hypothetical protein AAF430_23850 [Myxococcota bacterium]
MDWAGVAYTLIPAVAAYFLGSRIGRYQARASRAAELGPNEVAQREQEYRRVAKVYRDWHVEMRKQGARP